VGSRAAEGRSHLVAHETWIAQVAEMNDPAVTEDETDRVEESGGSSVFRIVSRVVPVLKDDPSHADARKGNLPT